MSRLFLLLPVFLQGCTPSPAESGPAQDEPVSSGLVVAGPPQTPVLERAPRPRELIYLEITPAAQAAVKSAAAAQKLETWWLRYELMPGGCTGFRHKLWLDAGPINRGEFEYRTPSVPFLLLESQRELVQGARIDYGTQNGQTGFIVTAPHASARTKAAIGQWLATDEKSHSRSGE